MLVCGKEEEEIALSGMVVTKDEIKCTVTAGLTHPTPRIENLVSVSVRLGYFHGELKPSVDAAMLIQSDPP